MAFAAALAPGGDKGAWTNEARADTSGTNPEESDVGFSLDVGERCTQNDTGRGIHSPLDISFAVAPASERLAGYKHQIALSDLFRFFGELEDQFPFCVGRPPDVHLSGGQ